MKYWKLISTCTLLAAVAFSAPAFAGPTLEFDTSTGNQPSNVGKIILTQINPNTVEVNLQLATGYGIVNTGGPNHVPFAFQLDVSGGLSILSWTTPSLGDGPHGNFTLDTSGGSTAPGSTFNTALDYSGGNGSSSGYFGNLDFELTRSCLLCGLSTTDFVSNAAGYYFGSDLSNAQTPGGTGNTGSQVWLAGTDPTPVPEPVTLSLFGAGLAGAAAMRRRRGKA